MCLFHCPFNQRPYIFFTQVQTFFNKTKPHVIHIIKKKLRKGAGYWTGLPAVLMPNRECVENFKRGGMGGGGGDNDGPVPRVLKCVLK